MVSTLNLDEKFNRVRRNFCFYLDIEDHGLARSISRRIQDLGLQQEWCLSGRVTHVVRSSRADAMLAGLRHSARHTYVTLTVQKAINLLDKLYDTFFSASRKSHVRLFTKHFIKIEFLDKPCRPIYKEFDAWPAVCPPERGAVCPPEREPAESPPERAAPAPGPAPAAAPRAMTRKSRARPLDKEEGGYCEMCNAEYGSAGAHRRSAHHAAFVRDQNNFLALDALIAAGADVASFLDKAAGEERGPRARRSPAAPAARSPRNGALRPAPCYRVVGAKLRSSGARRREPPPAAPLVVKFRKVRRSELSVLSDEAEQFMFPRRASDDSDSEDEPPPPAPPAVRRRRARPTALKEESSEEDGWAEDARPRKRRAPVAARRGRRRPGRASLASVEPEPAGEPAPPEPVGEPAPAASPLREEAESCMKWEEGRLRYTPAVERLEFAFESVPRSEPWYETFARQDRDRRLTRNIPQYFELYSTAAPKLPYELGQLPPPKPNCCALSGATRARAGPARAYGTRGTKRRRLRARAAELAAAEARPRKSPREHASTLAMLGAAGLLRRADDDKSTASEDAPPAPPPPSDARDLSERLRRFLGEQFAEREDVELCAAAAPLGAPPDLAALLRDDARDPLRDQLCEPPAAAPDVAKAEPSGSDAEPSTADAEPRTAAAPSAAAAGRRTRAKRKKGAARGRRKKPKQECSAASSECSAAADSEGSEERRRTLRGLCDWLPVVRVARVLPPRRLRSAARAHS